MIYTTTNFDGQEATDDTLLIGVGPASHRLVVVSKTRQLKFAASYDPANVEPAVTALLNRDFGSVKLAVTDCRYSFIPADVYDERQHDAYLRHLPFDGVGGADVADVAPLGIKVLYQTSRMGLETLVARFPHAVSCPQVQALLGAVADLGRHAGTPLLVIEQQAQWMTISVFNDGKFLYCHDFESHNEDDFSYHLLAVLNRFGLADRKPSIQLAGDTDLGDACYNRAATYGGEVVLADSSSLTGIQIPGDMVPHQHRFLSLFGLYLCE